jgi:hypothetical protein
MNAASVFDTEGSCMFLTDFAPHEMIALATSTFARYIIKCIVDHTVHAQIEDIKKLIIRKPDDLISKQLKNLVVQIIEKQKVDSRYPYYLNEQKQIDELVYQLYGLSDENIQEVELWYCRRYPKLAETQGMLTEVQQKYASHLERCERILSKPSGYWKSHPILQLIAQGEGPKLEFKETLEVNARTGERGSGVRTSTLKTIAAFLNTDGGTLLIGISDSGEVKGLDKDFRFCNRQNPDGMEQKLRSLIADRFKPRPLDMVAITFETLPEGIVCRIDVPKAYIVHLDNDVYVRDGNRTCKLQGVELTQWIRSRT